jgi:DNA repair ATPase RecN
MSRIMLAVKLVFITLFRVPTIILMKLIQEFPGEMAHKMGRKLKEMSSSMQVLPYTYHRYLR